MSNDQDQKFKLPLAKPQGDESSGFVFKPINVPKVDETTNAIEQALTPKKKTKRVWKCPCGINDPNCASAWQEEVEE